jgi:hypothetical protein
MTTILSKLEHATSIPTDSQIESLALERYNNALVVMRVDSTYLRVLVMASQAQLGKSKRGKVDAEGQTKVLESVHERFYAAVLRGVTTHDIAIEPGLDPKENTRRSLERNRRSAFARSAKSTLLAYVTGGGDLRALDPNNTSKAGLRKAVEKPEPTDRTERQIVRAKGSLYRALARQARASPDAAREAIETAVEELQALLEQLGPEVEERDEDEAPTPQPNRRATDQGHARTRVGIPMLNRGA